MDGWGLGGYSVGWGEPGIAVSSTGRLCLIDASWETCVCMGWDNKGQVGDKLGIDVSQAGAAGLRKG